MNQKEAEKKTGAELANKIQTTTISETSTSSKLSFRKWLNKEPMNHREARETPHTLHERRPPSDTSDLGNSQKDYIQQLDRQRESLSKQSRGKGSIGTARQQEEDELILPEIKMLSPKALYGLLQVLREGWRMKRSVQDKKNNGCLEESSDGEDTSGDVFCEQHHNPPFRGTVEGNSPNYQ